MFSTELVDIGDADDRGMTKSMLRYPMSKCAHPPKCSERMLVSLREW